MDIWRKPTSGEPFRPNARQQAALLEFAQKLFDRPGEALEREVDPGIIMIRNDTGGDLTIDHAIVGLGDPLIIPDDRSNIVYERPIFEGVTPDEDVHRGRYAVCLGPVFSNQFVLAVVSGWAWCKVTINNADHVEVEVVNGSTAALQTVADGNGSARLLWRAVSGTPRDALVSVGCKR